MAQKTSESQKLEKEALLKKHEFELAKLDEKHKSTNSSAAKPAAKKASK